MCQAADAFSTATACAEILKLIWEAGDLVALNAHILILTKRRAQLKNVRDSVVAWGAPKCAVYRCCVRRVHDACLDDLFSICRECIHVVEARRCVVVAPTA